MSTESKRLIDIKLTPWESEGVEREEGSRNWLPNEEPPSANFDYHFYWTHKNFQQLVNAIEEHLLPQRFYPDSIALIGDDAATYDYIEDATGGKIPVLAFAPGVYQECQIEARVRSDNTVAEPKHTQVEIEWSSAGNQTKTAAWQVKYFVVGDGETFQATPSTVQVQTADSSVVHGRVRTTIELPVLVQGKTLVLYIGHDGTNGNDEMEAACMVHSIAVI